VIVATNDKWATISQEVSTFKLDRVEEQRDAEKNSDNQEKADGETLLTTLPDSANEVLEDQLKEDADASAAPLPDTALENEDKEEVDSDDFAISAIKPLEDLPTVDLDLALESLDADLNLDSKVEDWNDPLKDLDNEFRELSLDSAPELVAGLDLELSDDTGELRVVATESSAAEATSKHSDLTASELKQISEEESIDVDEPSASSKAEENKTLSSGSSEGEEADNNDSTETAKDNSEIGFEKISLQAELDEVESILSSEPASAEVGSATPESANVKPYDPVSAELERIEKLLQAYSDDEDDDQATSKIAEPVIPELPEAEATSDQVAPSDKVEEADKPAEATGDDSALEQPVASQKESDAAPPEVSEFDDTRPTRRSLSSLVAKGKVEKQTYNFAKPTASATDLPSISEPSSPAASSTEAPASDVGEPKPAGDTFEFGGRAKPEGRSKFASLLSSSLGDTVSMRDLMENDEVPQAPVLDFSSPSQESFDSVSEVSVQDVPEVAEAPPEPPPPEPSPLGADGLPEPWLNLGKKTSDSLQTPKFEEKAKDSAPPAVGTTSSTRTFKTNAPRSTSDDLHWISTSDTNHKKLTDQDLGKIADPTGPKAVAENLKAEDQPPHTSDSKDSAKTPSTAVSTTNAPSLGSLQRTTTDSWTPSSQ